MSCYCKTLFVLVSLICLISLAQSITNGGGVTIGLIHRDSPLSPSHDSSKTRFQRLRDAIDRSFSRKSFLLRKTSRSTVDQTPQAPLTRAGGEFLIEYQIGTPPVRQLSIADTGSDLTWIQCNPCTNCYKQDYPLFDPTASTTYKTVGCGTATCTSGESTACNDKNVCQYKVQYGDQSFTQGDLATETLTLGRTVSFPNFAFGCGFDNGGTLGSTGSGIFGLRNGKISIVNQEPSTILGRFAYCLTSYDSNVKSNISFGSAAVVPRLKVNQVQSTPLVSKDPDTFYYLTLQGLSVGMQRVEQQSGGKGNIIIDSGTTLTFLPSGLYERFEALLKNAIQATPVSDPSGSFNLCYSSSSGVTAPPIIAHFEGADVLLPQDQIFLQVSEGLVCLTLVPSPDLAIYGNLHQAGLWIRYDIPNKQVNFLPDCTESIDRV
ncbi:hypothetical protein ACS0TY_032370 [Phlomoides rotata]